ncbi:hypothetical protein RMI40_14370 [Pseudomonas protegens]|uniref:hypothetical protein n=1 Tax=Pseudomonas protegens TaxID=380021 RepID=UPI00287BD73C|nr:hypothetical protein [Pseudomonas protegens]MDS9876034.1 hypothetical protein [Pseudomonas protegens]
MANEEQTPMATIFGFAEKYLKRPLTQVERQVLEAFAQDKPLDMSRAAQQSVDQARQRATELMQSDGLRTRQIIDQLAGSAAAGKADPQARELVLRQLLAAAESEEPLSVSPPGAGLVTTAAAAAAAAALAPALSPASFPPDDPQLKAMISALVQQEVKAAVEARMAGLSQKVEDTLKQLTAGGGQ